MKHFFFMLLLLNFHLCLSAQSLKLPVKIIGHADFLNDGDTVKLLLYKYGLINQEKSFQKVVIAAVHHHDFKFDFPAENHPLCINITFNNHRQSDLIACFVVSGDNVKLNFGNEEVVVTGPKSKNFEIQYQLRKIETDMEANRRLPEFNATNLQTFFLFHDSLTRREISFLKRHKNALSSQIFDALTTQINSSYDWLKYRFVNSYGEQYLESSFNPILESYHKYILQFKQLKVNVNNSSCYSDVYIQSLWEKYKVDSCLEKRRSYDITTCLNYFARNYRGILREQLVVATLCNGKQFPKDLKTSIERILPEITNPDYRQFLQLIVSTRVEGALAYNFSLKNVHDRTVHLMDFKDSVLVLDFWFTGCENCRELAPFMAKIEKTFQNACIKFIGISVDRNKDGWLKSVNSGIYVSPEIVNLYTGGKGTQSDIIKNYRVSAYPNLVLVSSKGTIINVSIDPRNDDGVELMKQINYCLK